MPKFHDMLSTVVRHPGAITRLSSLGETLELHRLGTGRSLGDLACRSGHSEADLRALETGVHEFSDDHIVALLSGYDIDRGSLRPHRSQAVLNLEAGLVSVAPTRQDVDEPAADQILLAYVALLYRQNGLRVGSELPIRQIDLTVVRRTLALRRDAVEVRVKELVHEQEAKRGLGSKRSGRGLAVVAGLAVMGAIVVIPATAGGAGPTAGPEPDSTNAATATVVAATSPSVVPAAVTLVGDIGTALTIERDTLPSAAIGSGPGLETARPAEPTLAGAIADAAPEVEQKMIDQMVAEIDPAETAVASALAPTTTRSAPTPAPAVGEPVGEIGDALVIER